MLLLGSRVFVVKPSRILRLTCSHRRKILTSPCFFSSKQSMKDPLPVEDIAENAPVQQREKSTELHSLKNDKAYPFMSQVQKNKFNYIDSFGYEERWKYEAHIIVVCIVIFFLYWGVLRQETEVDRMLDNPPGMEELNVRVAIGILKDQKKDCSEEEAVLRDLVAQRHQNDEA